MQQLLLAWAWARPGVPRCLPPSRSRSRFWSLAGALTGAAGLWRIHNDEALFWASVNIASPTRPAKTVLNQDCVEIQSQYTVARGGLTAASDSAELAPSRAGRH